MPLSAEQKEYASVRKCACTKEDQGICWYTTSFCTGVYRVWNFTLTIEVIFELSFLKS